MIRPILLYPVGKDNFNRLTYKGEEFSDLKALEIFQNNANFRNALIVCGDVVYHAKDITQAIADLG